MNYSVIFILNVNYNYALKIVVQQRTIVLIIG